MLLILSAQICESELVAEYGKLPPTFLPVGNKRLYELQIQQTKDFFPEEEIYLTLPKNFKLLDYDLTRLNKLNVHIIEVPSRLTIGESVNYALSQCDLSSDLRILYGDTYIADLDMNMSDVCAVSKVENEYKWHFIDDKEVICGYFAFSSAQNFFDVLLDAEFDFFLALKTYKQMFCLNNFSTNLWYDFGHIHTYYKSKTLITTARHFNVLEFKNFIVTKKSLNTRKCAAEANWYQLAPPAIKVHTPNFLGVHHNQDGSFLGYSIEYLYLSSLSELFVFSELGKLSWNVIIDSIFNLLGKMYDIKSSKLQTKFDAKAFYLGKTTSRLQQFSESVGFDLEQPLVINGIETPSLTEIATSTYNNIAPIKDEYLCFSHGDLCLSNILYDFRSNNVKIIDPRGIDGEDNFTLYGDIRYDIAKLAHSIVGKYDFIVASKIELDVNNNQFNIKFPKNDKKFAEDLFWIKVESFIPGVKSDIYNIMIHLFLSMLPLHADCKVRQMALLANALRLFVEVNK